MLRRRDILATAATGLVTVSALRTAAAEEKPSELVYESRTILALAPGPEAVSALLPAGWQSTPAPQGPVAGASVLLVLIDRMLATDAENKPLTPSSNRLAVLAAPAKAPDAEKPVTVILGGVSSDPAGAPGFYGAYVAGGIALERHRGRAAPDAMEERWTVTGEGGDRVQLDLAWNLASPMFTPFDQLITSGRDPKQRRRYVGDQGTVVLRSAPAKVDRLTHMTAEMAGPTFASLGPAQVVAVMSLPWYRRQTFVLSGG